MAAPKKIKVTLVKSTNSASATTARRCTAWASSGRTTRSRSIDTPAMRGMINKVSYLLKVARRSLSGQKERERTCD